MYKIGHPLNMFGNSFFLKVGNQPFFGLKRRILDQLGMICGGRFQARFLSWNDPLFLLWRFRKRSMGTRQQSD